MLPKSKPPSECAACHNHPSCIHTATIPLVQPDDCLQHPPASRWALSRTRRLLDIAIASLALIVSIIPMLIIAALIRIESAGHALFTQRRIGAHGALFNIYKFRSMFSGTHTQGESGITRPDDARLTLVGEYLRKFKLDELPQFYNVLRGDMSLVGPRPKLPRYAAIRNTPYRPGITGPATLVFRHEEDLLREVPPHAIDSFYAACIKPHKARLDVCYMCHASALSDLRIIVSTLLCCVSVRIDEVALPIASHSASTIQPRPNESEP